MRVAEASTVPPVDAVELSGGALVEVVRGALQAGASPWLRVTGQSMSPLLRQGDSVLLVRAESPAIGDVVFLDVFGMPMLHRLVARRGNFVETRGDACGAPDPRMGLEFIVGKAVLARRGEKLVALVPTIRFGVWPLIRYGGWAMRFRVRLFQRWLHTQRHAGVNSAG